MPIDKQVTLTTPKSRDDDFILPEGEHEAKVLDIEDAGFSKYDSTKRQFMFTFVVEEDDDQIKLRDWATNSWWWGDPQPSKLYKLYKAAGLVDKENNGPDDLNEIIGKPVIVHIVHKNDREGVKRARIRDYSRASQVSLDEAKKIFKNKK